MNLLTVVWDFNPVFFSIGDFDIRYYGLMWAAAILLGGYMFNYFCKREGLPQSLSDSTFVYITLATIIGSRVGHCLFYEPSYYLANPLRIITEIRDGGLASHGAAIGILIGVWLCARKNKVAKLWILDRLIIAVAAGGALVRLGNLFNSEIIGGVTTMPWGFKFVRLYHGVAVENIPVQHPTQLYEALCYILTFIVLGYMYLRRDAGRKYSGMLFGAGLIGIFLTRFLIEFIKLDQEAFEQGMWLNMGQWLSVPFILMGVYFIWYGRHYTPVVAMPQAHAKERTSTEAKHKTGKKW